MTNPLLKETHTHTLSPPLPEAKRWTIRGQMGHPDLDVRVSTSRCAMLGQTSSKSDLNRAAHAGHAAFWSELDGHRPNLHNVMSGVRKNGSG